MFVVKLPFRYQNESGEIIAAEVGDEIPGFLKWPLVVRRAHLSLEWVEELASEEFVSIKEELKPSSKKVRSSKK